MVDKDRFFSKFCHKQYLVTIRAPKEIEQNVMKFDFLKMSVLFLIWQLPMLKVSKECIFYSLEMSLKQVQHVFIYIVLSCYGQPITSTQLLGKTSKDVWC